MYLKKLVLLQTKEEDLQQYFCKFGVVRDTKIIRDRAEVSKGLVYCSYFNKFYILLLSSITIS